MPRIKIKSIAINSGWVSDTDDLRIVVYPFDLSGGELKEIVKQVATKKIVFHSSLQSSKKRDLNVVMDIENQLIIYVFARSRNLKSEAFNYLDTCCIRGNSIKDGFIHSKNNYFSIGYDLESLEDRVPVSEVTAYKFQIHSVKCNSKEDYGKDEIRFEFFIDENAETKRFPTNRSYFNFKKKQVRRFCKEDEIIIKFQKKIHLIVWEIDSPDGNDKLGEEIFTLSSMQVSKEKLVFKANKDDADYDIYYTISPVKTEKAVKRQSFSWELSSDIETINFDPFFERMEELKEKISTVLQTVPSESETPQPVLDEKSLSSLHEELNPLNRQETKNINKFISDYYNEFLSNTQLQEEYIRELTHSQYPVMAYPVYPEPVYYYLKQLSQRFILPASDSMPENSMALFINNPAFVEAFLCGMNTEMGRELLWREYPTDTRGSYFRKFWDNELKKDIGQELRSGAFFDVLPIHKWERRQSLSHQLPDNTHRLGQNHTKGKENLLIFAIKGELLKKYPETIIYLSKGKIEGDRILINPNSEKILPDLSAWLGEDIFIVGFPTKLENLMENPAAGCPGYFLTFMNRPGETRFGVNKDNYTNPVDHAGEYAANLLVQPYIYGKHVRQFLQNR